MAKEDSTPRTFESSMALVRNGLRPEEPETVAFRLDSKYDRDRWRIGTYDPQDDEQEEGGWTARDGGSYGDEEVVSWCRLEEKCAHPPDRAMSTLSPIEELREARQAYMDEPCPDSASTALDDWGKATDRVLDADISISWVDAGVRRTETTSHRAPDPAPELPPSLDVQCQQLRERVVGLEQTQLTFATLDRFARLEARILELEHGPAVEAGI